jgi:hypothetical protein
VCSCNGNKATYLALAGALRLMGAGLVQIAEVLDPQADQPATVDGPCQHPFASRVNISTMGTPDGFQAFGCTVCEAEFLVPVGQS